MIRWISKTDRRRARLEARRQWRRRFLWFRIVQVENHGRALIIAQTLETRWSEARRQRLWRLPE